MKIPHLTPQSNFWTLRELISLPCNERYPEACQAVWNAVASTVPDTVAVDYHADFRDVALNVSYGAVGANCQLRANRTGQLSRVREIDANLPLYLVWSRDHELAPIDKALSELKHSARTCQLP